MSQADRKVIIDLDSFDSATMALAQAIGILHCVHTAADRANLNQVTATLAADALDGAIAVLERARELLVSTPDGNGRASVHHAAGRA